MGRIFSSLYFLFDFLVREVKMVEKVIKALRNFGLNTYFGPHSLSKDEIKKIEFRNQREFDALLKIGYFIEVAANMDIPVIRPKVDEDTIVRVDPVDEVDPPEGIDSNKPDLPCPEEDQKPTIEELEAILDSKEETSIETLPNGEIRAVEVPLDEAQEPEEKETPENQERSEPHNTDSDTFDGVVHDVSLYDKTPTPEEIERVATEGMVEMGFEEQSVEEIPIEEQDENKPELKSDEVVDD